VQQLKGKFSKTTNRSVKLSNLILPKDWSRSIRKTKEFSGASKYLICTAKQLIKEYGTQASPNPKFGRSLDPEAACTIETFDCNDSNSRFMLRKKD
jgi:hypothetical protein